MTMVSSGMLRRHGARCLLRSMTTTTRTTRTAVRLTGMKPFGGVSATRRFLSTEASTAAANKPSPAKKNDSNIFLDNLGTIFLLTIGTIIGTLVRSSYNGSNRLQLRSDIELESELDPYEIDDLREANSEFKPEIFRRVAEAARTDFPTGTATYQEFVLSVRTTMRGIYGDAFTIELGHLMDRVVAAAFEARGKDLRTDQESLVFWFTVLSMALHSDASDRIRVLYEALQHSQHVGGSNNDIPTDTTGTTITVKGVEELVAALQDTCQLVSDKQTVPTDVKIPTQQYRRATPSDLLQWEEGTENDQVDLQGLAAILRSRSVCAWGECYLKKKPEV